jgi:NADH:ubiquinone reductase (H+-translocating)
MHRAVIIGAGFGGLSAARTLARESVAVTLIDQRNFHTFQPLLYEVATAGLDPGDVAYPVRAVTGRLPNVDFRLGTVTAIDWSKQVVCLAGSGAARDPSSDACVDDVPFDSLIIASGAVANFFGIEGATRYAHPLYTLEDASVLRDHILRCLEQADSRGDQAPQGTLNFVVVGGGPTGVEVSGAIAELLDMAMRRDGFRIDRSTARIVLIDGLDSLLSAFEPKAQRYAEAELTSRSVELKLGTMVDRIDGAGVELKGGEVIPSRTVVWAGGVTVKGTAASSIDAKTDRNGRLVVDSDLRVAGHQGVYAIGDAAAIPLAPGSEATCPQLAQVAIQSGRHAAKQILAAVNGGAPTPFRYRDKGIMATIGRRAAVAQIGSGIVLRGTIGWLSWFGLHLLYLIGFRNRLVVLVNWTWRYLSWTSGPRIIMGDASVDDRTSDGDSGHP